MKNTVTLLVAVLGITLLSLSVVSPVFASESFQGGQGKGGEGFDGIGNQGAIGTGTGIPVDQSINLDGILEDLMHEYLAEAIGMTSEELDKSLETGETFSEIALGLGSDPAEISSMIVNARADAMAQAVVDGLISQIQVDWLASRGNQIPAANFGEEVCDFTGDCLEDGIQQNTMMEYGYRKGYGK